MKPQLYLPHKSPEANMLLYLGLCALLCSFGSPKLLDDGITMTVARSLLKAT